MHRLDQPTGGLVMVAKSRPALSALSAAFSQREVKKTYMAVVCGRCPHSPVQGCGILARAILATAVCMRVQQIYGQPWPRQPLTPADAVIVGADKVAQLMPGCPASVTLLKQHSGNCCMLDTRLSSASPRLP